MCERIIVVCILLFLGDLARAHFMVPSKTIQIGPKENQKTPAWATSLWREGNRWFGNAQKNPAEQGKLAEADEEPEPIHSQLERIEMQRTIYTKITNNHVPVPRPSMQHSSRNR
ncbi:unnamed protein product [Fasciola hepatica]|uniref:Secreted protein n=1 Tax=Fasciola hepatica TaxID=6192 RepID=A0ABC9HIX9_FASHE